MSQCECRYAEGRAAYQCVAEAAPGSRLCAFCAAWCATRRDAWTMGTGPRHDAEEAG
jgi:hypothetical protein